jgi:hypothetical protein
MVKQKNFNIAAMTGFFFPGEQPGDYMTLESGPRLVISGNGSVLIRAVDPSHEGHYTCQASNGIGSGLSKVIFLRVNGKYVPQTSKLFIIFRILILLSCFGETFRDHHIYYRIPTLLLFTDVG